jgi:hypothetical protein
MRRYFAKTNRKNKKHQTTRRRLRFESLESRELLAGDVTAVMRGSTLLIKGDNDGNGVTVGQGIVAEADAGVGAIVVTGVDWDGAPTTINGSDSAAFFPETTNVFVRLKKGNDYFVVSNAPAATGDCLGTVEETGSGDVKGEFAFSDVHIPGSLNVNGGRDNDWIGIGPDAHIGKHVIANTGHGMDAVGVCLSEIGQNLVVDTGNHGDLVGIDPNLFGISIPGSTAEQAANGVLGSTIHGSVRIFTGNGDDLVGIGSGGGRVGLETADIGIANEPIDETLIHIGRGVGIYTGNGNDAVSVGVNFFGPIPIGSGDIGTETIAGAPSIDIGQNFTLDTGNGHDNASVTHTNVAMNFFGNLGNGHDTFFSDDLHAGAHGVGSAFLNTGNGHDDVYVEDLHSSGNFFANLGSGNDCIGVFDSAVDNLALFIGGRGRDGLDHAGNDFGRIVDVLFEFDGCDD